MKQRRVFLVVSMISAWAMLAASPAMATTTTRTAPYAWSDSDTLCLYPDRGTCDLSAQADRDTGNIEVLATRGAKPRNWEEGGLAQAVGLVSGHTRTSKGARTLRAVVTLQVHSATAALTSGISGDLAYLWASAKIETKSNGEWVYFDSGTRIVDSDEATTHPSSYSGDIILTVETALGDGQTLDGGAYLHLYLVAQGRLTFPTWQPSLFDRSATATGRVTVTSIQFTSF